MVDRQKMLLRSVLLIYRSEGNNAKEKADLCSKELSLMGIKAITSVTKRIKNYLLKLKEENQNLPDLAIVLGGDGTVLEAARELANLSIPILSFNIGGHLGFLTHDENLFKDKRLWERIKNNEFSSENRIMLQAHIEPVSIEERKKNTTQNYWALNDFYIRAYRDDISPTCTLQIEIDGEKVDQYKGDGLILSTPTGSTAYAMASGGPILHPGIKGIIVSPICPMSLSSRPIVVPSSSSIVIRPLGDRNRKVKLWQDGASASLIGHDECCVIKRANDDAQIIVLEQSPSYYRTLTQKLHWAGSLAKNRI